MAIKTLILALIFFTLFFFSSMTTSIPTSKLLQAAEVVSNSGYLSMSLTLQLISNTLIVPHSPSLTIFSPSDSAFVQSGQPSLSLLQFHVCPLSFHLYSLKSLPSGSKIPTLSSNYSIIITSDNDGGSLSLNGVKILGSLYDDGSLVILGVDKFLDPDFVVSLPASPAPVPVPSANLRCGFGCGNGIFLFKEATDVLRANGCSVMASFLDLQLMGFKEKEKPVLTVFAPLDDVMKGFLGNVDQYSLIFLRHVVPCKITWRDLVNFHDGVVIDTYLKGFGIRVSTSGDILMINEVPVSFADMYHNEWLVVHGIRGMLDGPDEQEEVGESSSHYLN